MKMVRVWFNHWFSTAYHIIELMKQDANFNFVIVGSNTDSNCVYRAVCDEWKTEEKYSNGDSYVDFCLEFCRQKQIDIFAVRRNMLAVSRRMAEFSAIGVKVLADEYDILRLFADKGRTYQLFSDNGIGNVPKYYIANSVSEFEKAYHQLKTDQNRICFKFASDEGAVSFRVVDNKIEYNLTETIGMKLTYNDAIKTLERYEKLPPLMVMPYLRGTEVSVDCLRMNDGNHIIVPRYKTWGRSEVVKFEPEVIRLCEQFINSTEINFPINPQFRYDGETLYLLEVNTRMSGGIQLSCAAAGVNIPNLAINRLLGVEKNISYSKENKVVSFIETPVVMGGVL